MDRRSVAVCTIIYFEGLGLGVGVRLGLESGLGVRLALGLELRIGARAYSYAHQSGPRPSTDLT